MLPTPTAINSKIIVGRKKTLWESVIKYRVLLLMTLPGAVYFFINNYLPMFGVLIAFKDINYVVGIWTSEWVGFRKSVV